MRTVKIRASLETNSYLDEPRSLPRSRLNSDTAFVFGICRFLLFHKQLHRTSWAFNVKL